jgi:hypothetical protein
MAGRRVAVTITSGRVAAGSSAVPAQAGRGRSTAAAVAWRMDRVMAQISVGPALALRGGM